MRALGKPDLFGLTHRLCGFETVKANETVREGAKRKAVRSIFSCIFARKDEEGPDVDGREGFKGCS